MPPFHPENRRFITSFDPATSLHLGTFVADSEEEILHKQRLALDAWVNWRETAFSERRRVIRSLKKWLVDNQDICARVSARDTGKTCG